VHGRWSRSSREIYDRNGHDIVAVPMTASGAEPAFGKPTALFADEYDFRAEVGSRVGRRALSSARRGA
jgi:hypothetical protein